MHKEYWGGMVIGFLICFIPWWLSISIVVGIIIFSLLHKGKKDQC